MAQDDLSLKRAFARRVAPIASTLPKPASFPQRAGQAARLATELKGAVTDVGKQAVRSAGGAVLGVGQDLARGFSGGEPSPEIPGEIPGSRSAGLGGGAPAVPMPARPTAAGQTGEFEKLGAGGLTTAVDAAGNSMSGVDRPGGSFQVEAGPAAGTPGYGDMTNDEKIAANVAAYNAQSDALRGGPAPAGAPTRTPGGGGSSPQGTTMADAMQSYLKGDVGSEGYRMIRSMRMKTRADEERRLRAARNTAAGVPPRYRAKAIGEVLSQGQGGQLELPQDTRRAGGSSMRDALDIARFNRELQGDQRREAREATEDRRAEERLGMDREEAQLRRARSEQEMADTARERQAEFLDGLVGNPRFGDAPMEQVGPQLTRMAAEVGASPEFAADVFAQMQADQPADFNDPEVAAMAMGLLKQRIAAELGQ